jgi:hypothetical protein
MLQEFIANKKQAADIGYLEEVNRADGCTALLCAVKKADLVTAQIVSTTLNTSHTACVLCSDLLISFVMMTCRVERSLNLCEPCLVCTF